MFKILKWVSIGSLGVGFALAASAASHPSVSPADLIRLKGACAEAVESSPVGDLTASRLQEVVSERRPQDSDSLLEILQGDPALSGFLASFMLMGNSGSLQQAAVDLDHPRILSYHRSAIIGLTGSVDFVHQDLNRRLEEFRYDFANESWAPSLTELSGSSAPFYQDRPAACTACHGTPARPLWRSYRIWPGAYVTHQDYFRPQEQNGRHFAGRPEFDPDADGLEFIRKLTGPYRHLKPTDLDPGADLNHFLNRMNFRRLAHELRSAPDFSHYETAAVAALLGCGDVPAYLGLAGTPLRDRHEATHPGTIPAFEREITSHVTDSYVRIEALQDRLYNALSSYGEDEFDRRRNELLDVSRVAALRYLFESRGVNVKAFSLSREPGPDTYGYGFHEFAGEQGGLWRLACAFIPGMVERDPSRFGGLVKYDPAYADEGSHPELPLCRVLRTAAGLP